MFLWPVAVIKQGLIVLLCIYSPICKLGMETQKCSFSKATGECFRAGHGMQLLGIAAWGPCPAVGSGTVLSLSSAAPVGWLLLKQSLQLGMFIILLLMKPLHCSHSSELRLIDFHFVFSVKSYLINAETCREQLISSRQFLFKWLAQMCFAWGFLERKKRFCRKFLQIINGKPRVSTCWVRLLPFSLLGMCSLAAVEDKFYSIGYMHSVGFKKLALMDSL